MQHRIEISNEKKLIGKRLTMSLSENKTGELWKSFIPRIKEIVDSISNDYISMTIYPATYFSDFKPANKFEKWAAIEVSKFDNVPDDMETFIIDEGLYAVFEYKGSSNDLGIFQMIFATWLPDSEYLVDDRPHFEILGNKYKNNDPASEEEIWIPIKYNQ